MTLQDKIKKLTPLEQKALEEQLDKMVGQSDLDVQNVINCACILHTLLCVKEHSGEKLTCTFYKGEQDKKSDFALYVDRIEELMHLLSYADIEEFSQDLSVITRDILKVETYEFAKQERLFIAIFLMKHLRGEAVLSQVSDVLNENALSKIQSSSSEEGQEPSDTKD